MGKVAGHTDVMPTNSKRGPKAAENTENTKSPLLTIGETASRLRVAPKTLTNWRYASPRKGPVPSRSGGRIVYHQDAVEAYIAEQARLSNLSWSA